jgi:hypothetical protein
MEKKEQAMEGKILVLLRRHNRIEDILPSLEKIAQPGMKVVFLIPYPAKLWPWLRDHWVTTESSREAIVLGKKIADEYSWEAQKELAEQKIALARDVLQKRQVEVDATICASSMKRAIEDHNVDGEAQLVLLHAGSNHLLINILRRSFFSFGAFKRRVFRPMLLVYPGQ